MEGNSVYCGFYILRVELKGDVVCRSFWPDFFLVVGLFTRDFFLLFCFF